MLVESGIRFRLPVSSTVKVELEDCAAETRRARRGAVDQS
jgi:hypothetical protein